MLSLVDKIAREAGNKEKEAQENKAQKVNSPNRAKESVNKTVVWDKNVLNNRRNNEHVVHGKGNGNGKEQKFSERHSVCANANKIIPLNDEAFKDF